MWRLPDCRQVPVLHRDPVDLPVPHADLHATRFGIQVIRQLTICTKPLARRTLPRVRGSAVVERQRSKTAPFIHLAATLHAGAATPERLPY